MNLPRRIMFFLRPLETYLFPSANFDSPLFVTMRSHFLLRNVARMLKYPPATVKTKIVVVTPFRRAKLSAGSGLDVSRLQTVYSFSW